ncbi:hypothetical protein M947_06435 [Sulfurimonas hongkongensis]|uniref:Uncharacterized protein n=1 Tax=Sulfurimonas hongkongensis TaxID=1172190 RepID=T0JRX0_9BACT|nr:hypothetical protein [Sulfurimonas hongkongensis]EQB39627.1 hypothetical protein M947_06435 [Sulfurimonas hongkongensis]
MKHLLSLLFITNLLNASMLLDSYNICIEDYYIQNKRLYFLPSSTMLWESTRDKNILKSVIHSYKYNSSTNRCEPDLSLKMGLQLEQFNFLLALIGVIFGGVFMFFTTQIFINVGGRR